MTKPQIAGKITILVFWKQGMVKFGITLDWGSRERQFKSVYPDLLGNA